MTDQYAVIGHPIEHSKSPQIHAEFAQQTGQDIEYIKILGDLDHFEAQVKAFFERGKGMNVTIPFKERAYRLVDELGYDAQVAQAVNTLIPLADGRLRGENTDGIGLVRDLKQNHHFSFAGKSVLLLGAGGAAKGIAMPLLSQGISRLLIANRTVSRAEQLVEHINLDRAKACGFSDLNGHSFDLIINATASGLQGQVPDIPDEVVQAGKTWVYDLMYAHQPTCFEQWGRERGAFKVMDGLGMLVEQAAESFYHWRGVRPQTSPVIQKIRQELIKTLD